MRKQLFQTSLALSKAGFKTRNEGNYLGVIWYILDPLMMFAVFVFVRGILGSGVEYYPVYLIVGLTMFNFFRKTTSAATSSVTGGGGLFGNLKIDPAVFVLSTFFVSIFSHLFELLIVITLMIVYSLPLWYLVFYPLVFVLLASFTLGVCFLISSVAVYIPDIGKMWGLLTRILFFVTPIFYSARLELPFDINKYNPLYYYMTMGREALVYHNMPETWMIIAGILVSLLVLLLGIVIFHKTKHGFAERL